MSDQTPDETTSSDAVDAFDLHRHVSWDFQRNLDTIVKELRRLADRVERVKAPEPNQKNPDFGNVASIVVADVMNMMPNLALSGLVRSAAQADVALLHDRSNTPL